MRYGWMLLLMAISQTVQADIFKCEVHGKWVFSDQPCADDAEKVELSIRQPSAADVQDQQARTQQYQQEAKYTDIESLNAKNKALEAQIQQLEQQRQQTLSKMNEKTYRVDEDTIGTREHGLFKQMREVSADYDEKIWAIQQQIQQNNQAIDRHYQ
jgi:vacuolar-type H+-ATPase subunit I/STV1